ncbi:unnamed protein product [Camellia sinensis]
MGIYKGLPLRIFFFDVYTQVISGKDQEQFGFPDIFYQNVDHFGWGMHYCPISCLFLLIDHRS